MPGFVGHTTANAVVLVGTTSVMWAQGWSVPDILAVDAGIVIATLVLSPDMDLYTSKSMQQWGWRRIFWLPYAKLAKHRDRLHLPVLGTAVRWLYWAALIALAVILFRFLFRRVGLQIDFSFDGDSADIVYNLLYLADVFLGAVLADTMHYVLDMTTTHVKRLVPRRYRDRYDRYLTNHWEHDHKEPHAPNGGARYWERNFPQRDRR